ncbi:MAG TPA: NUDIX domain-containing protein [Nevskiaceae bacterium]|nr:NUDIX domain-containing protein [Nevskiaceae bacterium]
MRKAVRAIVIKDNCLLVMHRNKFGHEYYTLVGGGIRFGESAEHALLREIHEETNLKVTDPRLVFVEEAGAPYGTQYIYLCEYQSGAVALHPLAMESIINKLGQNLHTPMWLPLKDLPDVPFRSENLKQAILHAVKNTFPSEVQEV